MLFSNSGGVVNYLAQFRPVHCSLSGKHTVDPGKTLVHVDA